ncbi:MAG TPA: thioredoxin family protein [Candidatus Limnocylindria bacterium]|jgi:thioredoxin-related protein|nr:thioredoxin family protein [Candidatus Limnocylindria bacterium]
MKRLLAALVLTGSLALLAAPPGWHDDFAKAQGFAKKTHRPMLLNFTGSDWCIWCKRMKAETLDQKPFIAYASTNLLLVEVDFPNSKPLTKEQQDANEALKQKYQVNGFPTFVLVDAEGTELGRQVGYLKGGVPAFTKEVDEWRANMAKAKAAQ